MNFTNPDVASAEQLQIFPIKQASGSNQYTLGRAFLQEAVLVVDFERQNFSISQAINVPTNTAAQIINIISPDDVTSSGGGTSTSPAPSPSSTGVTPVETSASSSSFPTGAIAGIVIAVIAIAAAVLAFFCIRRRRSKKRAPAVLDHNEGGMAVKRPLVPELGETRSPEDSYFPHSDSKATPAYHVSESEVPASEMDSPQMRGLPFAAMPQHIDHITNVSELPANKDPAAELHSGPVSPTSNSPPPGGFTWASASRGSPIAEESSPTATSAAEGAWGTSYMEPSSPESARSVPIKLVKGKAHIVSGSARSPTHGSPSGSVDNTGMSATIGSTSVPGFGAYTLDEVHGKPSQRSSQSTLVGGASGRVSPETGVGTNLTNPSAFASPELIPIQRPSMQRHDSGPDTVLLDMESPSEIEGPR